MWFDDLYGQNKIKKILTEAVSSGRLGHAYMFTGPEGIGKKTFAERFAKIVMCTGYGEERPCGECESCRLMREGFDPDCMIADVPKGKTLFPVEGVRDIQEKLLTGPAYGLKKVVIFRNADKMSLGAQNALLKTLEEPPEYCVMILLCSNKEQMIETVQSRVVTLDFDRYTDEEILSYCRDHPEVSGDTDLILSFCDGIIGRVNEAGSGKETADIRKTVPEIIENIQRDRYEASKKLQDLLRKYSERKAFIFYTLRSLYMDMALVGRYGSRTDIQNKDMTETVLDLAKKVNYHDCMSNGEIVDETWKMIGKNANLKLAADRMIILLK